MSSQQESHNVMSGGSTAGQPGVPTVSGKALVDALVEGNRSCLAEHDYPTKACETDREALLTCRPPKASEEPEARFAFRRPLPILPVELRALEPEETDQLRLSHCLPIRTDDLKIAVTLDLLFEQRWYFRDLLVSAIVSTIALAPAEVLRLTIRSSQRKVLSRTTLDEVEEAESAEATIIDRDALNITRSSSRTSNWNVSGNFSLGIPIGDVFLGIGGGGGTSGSATDTAQSTAEHVSETTQRSARNLRNLHRVEVTETSETFAERRRARRLENPYRDRSLLVKVYALVKKFCVDFSLENTRPSLTIGVTTLPFDEEFVVANGDFLDRHLTDRRLAIDLPDALETVLNRSPLDATKEVERLALMALHYLFDEPNIFNVKDIGGSDANAPDTSFDARLSDSGLSDATSNRLGAVFTTLNFFFRLYRDQVGDDGKLATHVALSIEQALSPLWFEPEERESISKVLNESDRTEAFRRLSGFLAFVSGTIRPLLQPAADERERVQATRRAEFMIERVVRHLRCHEDFYIARYLEYLAQMTEGATLQSFVRDLLGLIAQPPELRDRVEELFATEFVFVEGKTIVVPGRCVYAEEVSHNFIAALRTSSAEQLPFGVLASDVIFAPTEGYYLEPVEGACRLSDVPEAPGEAAIRLSLAEEPIDVRIVDEGT